MKFWESDFSDYGRHKRPKTLRLTTSKTPSSSVLAPSSKNSFVFFNKTVSSILFRLVLALVIFFGLWFFFFFCWRTAVKKHVQTRVLFSSHHKAGKTTAFTVQNQENTPGKLSTMTHNSFYPAHIALLLCHHTVFKPFQWGQKTRNKLKVGGFCFLCFFAKLSSVSYWEMDPNNHVLLSTSSLMIAWPFAQS